ncbi:MAG: UvrB/UvrC motif-containing protein [bacterium]
MKCTICGKNNASYHYRTNINGRITEAHLCPECAGKAENIPEEVRNWDDDRLFGSFDRMFDDFFRRPFGSLSGFMPSLLLAGPSVETSAEPRQQPQVVESTPAPADDGLARRRQVNALRNQMHEAAAREDYEEAARLRDELKKLEG